MAHSPALRVGGSRPARAVFGPLAAEGLVEVVDLQVRPEVLDGSGWWAVVGTFEGRLTGYRFERVSTMHHPTTAPPGWLGPDRTAWRSSLSAQQYRTGVQLIREAIAAGDVYQVNLCRILSADDTGADPAGLSARLLRSNPAPWSGMLDLGADWVVSASPELFLRRDGDRLVSAPVKGTAAPGEPFADKDFPENVMICDLVRNDLSQVAVAGSVRVTSLLAREEHPGLAHLVSTVAARLRPGLGWGDLLRATFPPGSVSGAPKISALQVISRLEPTPRGPYCGCFGFVDADRGTAALAVGIRTFIRSAGTIAFGTGAGITWASDPQAEWAETELKAARLIGLASG